MINNLKKNIISTIVYYDCLNYPLTAFEVWKYLMKNQELANDNQKAETSLIEIVESLRGEELAEFIDEYRGFYFLKGRKKLVVERIGKNKVSMEKMKKITKAAFWLRFSPFVRMIAATGTVAMKNAKKGSDLDLLVVFKKDRIFTGRFFFTALCHILRIRRHGKKVKNRLCLNFFLTEDSLEITLKDLFSSSEYMFIRPVFGFSVFQKFQKENSWIGDFRKNFSCDEVAPLNEVKDGLRSKFFRKILESFLQFDFLENFFKKIQLKKIQKNPKTKKAGGMIVADDERMIFLPEPQGPKIFERFREKMEKMKAG